MRRNERGQAAVEFVLVSIILIIVMLGIIDFSRAWWELNSLNYGAREGARFASVTSDLVIDDPRVVMRVKDVLDEMIDPAELTVSVTFDNSTNPAAGDPVTVSVTHLFQSWLNNLIPVLPQTYNLKGQTTMRYEVY